MMMMMMIKKVTRPAARPWRKFGLDVSASISGRSTTLVKSEDTFFVKRVVCFHNYTSLPITHCFNYLLEQKYICAR